MMEAAGTVVVAFLLGSGNRAAVALLLAPASARRRKILTEKAKEGRKATDAARQGRRVPQPPAGTHSDPLSIPGRDAYNQARTGPMGPTGESVNLSETFLGAIALATLLMALIEVGAIVAILRVARQTHQTLADVQRDVRPLIVKAAAIADEASRTATIAASRPRRSTGC